MKYFVTLSRGTRREDMQPVLATHDPGVVRAVLDALACIGTAEVKATAHDRAPITLWGARPARGSNQDGRE